jgi:hypothetical protein
MTRRIAIGAFVAAVSVAALSADQRVTHEREILVGATQGNGTPATGLTVTDFVVREDRLSREVVRVDPAPPPSHLVLLVDDSQESQESIPFLRAGLGGFIKTVGALAPTPQFSLWTFGERPTRRVDFSPAPGAALDASSKIFAVGGSGAYFLEAVSDACKDLKKRGATNPVIVAFVAEGGPEFSNETHQQVSAALQGANASLWIVLLQVTNQRDLSPEEHERAQVLGGVAGDTGGLTRHVLSTQGIEPAFASVAAIIASRYLVVYGRPEQTIPPSVVEVTSKRSDVKLLSSRWPRS